MYGLNEDDLKNIQMKVDNQKNYLENNFFTTNSGQVKTLLDVSFSANHSKRYYAQLSNKVNTLTSLSMSMALHSVFITVTLDGFYRDMHHGDYKRFNSFSKEKQEEILLSVPKSDIYGNVYQKILDRLPLSVKDLYNILNYQTKNFFKSTAFYHLRKSGQKYIYKKAVEPHKDGVPHLHFLLMIPKELINEFKKSFVKSFPAPQNRRILNSKKFATVDNVEDYELEAFQTDINNPTGYIMKYITKSFMNLNNQEDIDYLQAWYIKHRITRFTTSRTLVPQWIYQKVYAFEQDWFYLSEMLQDPNCFAEWSHEDNWFQFIDRDGREIIYEYGRLQVLYNDRVLKEMGTVKEKSYKVDIYDKVPSFWNKKDNKFVPIYDDYKKIGVYNGSQTVLYAESISPEFKTDLELYEYFNNLDIDTCNLVHYGYIKNTLIERGFFNEEKISLNLYENVSNF